MKFLYLLLTITCATNSNGMHTKSKKQISPKVQEVCNKDIQEFVFDPVDFIAIEGWQKSVNLFACLCIHTAHKHDRETKEKTIYNTEDRQNIICTSSLETLTYVWQRIEQHDKKLFDTIVAECKFHRHKVTDIEALYKLNLPFIRTKSSQ